MANLGPQPRPTGRPGGRHAAALAQQSDQLLHELQDLKQEYTATTQALELRMAALELQIEKQKEFSERTKEATVSIVDLATEKAAQQVVLWRSDEVGAKFLRQRQVMFRSTGVAP